MRALKQTIAFVFIALLAHAWGADSPIVIGDGSIVIGNPGGSLEKWRIVNRGAIEHPQQGNSLAELQVTGPNATPSATCAGRGRCEVEIRWSSGQSIRLFGTGAGNRGARLEAQGVTFDDPAWQKSASQWRFSLPANATPTVTIRDAASGGQPQTVCSGKGCQVTVHYR